MKSPILSVLAITVAAWSAAPALAADTTTSLTREQVSAELAQAQRNGDIVVNAETGLKANEVAPGNYPAKASAQGKTREQVQAELAQALRSGDIPVDGVTGLKANQLAPGNYPAPVAAQATSREQVQSELTSAIRHGALPVHGSV